MALFVFVGPHSVIRLLNAPRPSSFPPPQPLCRPPRGEEEEEEEEEWVATIVAVKSTRR